VFKPKEMFSRTDLVQVKSFKHWDLSSDGKIVAVSDGEKVNFFDDEGNLCWLNATNKGEGLNFKVEVMKWHEISNILFLVGAAKIQAVNETGIISRSLWKPRENALVFPASKIACSETAVLISDPENFHFFDFSTGRLEFRQSLVLGGITEILVCKSAFIFLTLNGEVMEFDGDRLKEMFSLSEDLPVLSASDGKSPFFIKKNGDLVRPGNSENSFSIACANIGLLQGSFVNENLLATVSHESMIRFWNFKNEEAFSVSLPDNTKKLSFLSGQKNRVYAISDDGNGFCFEPVDIHNPYEAWKITGQFLVPLHGNRILSQSNGICVSTKEETISMLKPFKMIGNFKSEKNFAVQISPHEVLVGDGSKITSSEYKIRGLSVGMDGFVLVYGLNEFQIIKKSLPALSIKLKSVAITAGAFIKDSIFLICTSDHVKSLYDIRKGLLGSFNEDSSTIMQIFNGSIYTCLLTAASVVEIHSWKSKLFLEATVKSGKSGIAIQSVTIRDYVFGLIYMDGTVELFDYRFNRRFSVTSVIQLTGKIVEILFDVVDDRLFLVKDDKNQIQLFLYDQYLTAFKNFNNSPIIGCSGVLNGYDYVFGLVEGSILDRKNDGIFKKYTLIQDITALVFLMSETLSVDDFKDPKMMVTAITDFVQLKIFYKQLKVFLKDKRELLMDVYQELIMRDETDISFPLAMDPGTYTEVLVKMGKLDLLVNFAEKHDRISLKPAWFELARNQENQGNLSQAIELYGKSGRAVEESIRIFLENGDESILDKIPDEKGDREYTLNEVRGRIAELRGDKVQANFLYKDSPFFQVKMMASETEKLTHFETSDRAALLFAGAALEQGGDLHGAMDYFRQSQSADQMLRVALLYGADAGTVFESAMNAKYPCLIGKAANFLETNSQFSKAIQLYGKIGQFKKAIEISVTHKLFDSLRILLSQIPGTNETLKSYQITAAEILLENLQYSHAVEVYVSIGETEKALGIFSAHFEDIELSEVTAEKLTPAKDYPGRSEILAKIAKNLKKQGYFMAACKKYTQAGLKLKAVKCLIKSGDYEKVISFANTAREMEVYKISANFLMSLSDPKPEVKKAIELFLTKAKDQESLKNFKDLMEGTPLDAGVIKAAPHVNKRPQSSYIEESINR
jgi:tetratricopeptide (TPR) repeat protein